jgi:hypothetical protein
VLAASLTTLASAVRAQVATVFELTAEHSQSGFGRIEYLGDVDGDGFDDFAVGAPNEDVDLDGDGSISSSEIRVGTVRVWSGRRVGEPLRTWHGDAANEGFGAEIAVADDLDGDGHADIAIGAPSLDRTAQHAYVRLYSGRSFVDPAAPELLGTLTDDADRDGSGGPDGDQGHFGAEIAPAGDVDGDGFPDLLTAGAASYRWVVLWSGRTLAPLFTWDLQPTGAARTGPHPTAVASFGRDLDGDGSIELVFGNWHASQPGRREAGVVLVFSGMTATPIVELRGRKHHDWFGYAVAVMADQSGDADSLPELLIGAPGTFENVYGDSENGNYVDLHYGEALATRVLELRGETVGAGPGSWFGAYLDTCEYVADPEDGATPRLELLVAARHHDEDRGRIACLTFDPADPAWNLRFTLDGREPSDSIGHIAANGRITAPADDLATPDAFADPLISSGHVNIGDSVRYGRITVLTSAPGVPASHGLSGEAWAGDDTDPALLPTIDLAAEPVLGTLAEVELDCPLDPFTWGLLLIGLGTDATPGAPHLLVSDYVVLSFALPGAATTLPIQIPADPEWFTLGADYHAQALFALESVPGGIGYSARLDATLGGGSW